MNQNALSDLVALGEGFTTEFKRSGTAGLGREICAFANATGGTILLGVADDGEVCGIANHNRLKSEVQSIARSADPPIAVEIESVDQALCVRVPAQQSKPYSFGGKFFIREGASSQQMSREEIREFFFKEGLIRFDETPCRSFDLERDLTEENWERFAQRAGLPEGLEPVATLQNLHLAKVGEMTHAGAWLLAEDITHHTLRAGVTCAVLRGVTKTHILDRKEFTGDLYSTFEDCMTYLQAKLNTALIPHARGRDERLELPTEALREVLVNAIAHRDYRSTANVQVYVFRDRVEIVTPGGLPAGMHKEDLGTKSVPRNPLLFGMFYRMGLVEQIGSGIRRIRQLCRDYKVAEPLIDVSENWVTTAFARQIEHAADQETQHVTPQVTDKYPTSDLQVTLQVRNLIRCLDGEQTRAEILQRLRLKDRTNLAKEYIQPALVEGLIEMTIPDRPRSSKQKYRLTEKGRELQDRVSENGETTAFARQVEHAADRGSQHVTPQVTDKHPTSARHVTPQVRNLIRCLDGEQTRAEILQRLGLKDRTNLAKVYVQPALAEGLIEMTIPDRPRSSKQKYRLTERGRELQDRLRQAR